MTTNQSNTRLARAWIILLSAATVHVIDEWLTGFVPFFNQMCHELGKRFSFCPTPTLGEGAWLGALGVALIIGFALTPLVRRGSRVMRALAIVLSILMILNACLHLLGSLYAGRLLPGFWSSPLLFCAGSFATWRFLSTPSGAPGRL